MYDFTLKPTTNRQDWIDGGRVVDENNALVDITGAQIVLGMYDRETNGQRIAASTSDYITITGLGTFMWNVPVASMRGICPETYNVGLTIVLNGVTTQLGTGSVAVLPGYTP